MFSIFSRTVTTVTVSGVLGRSVLLPCNTSALDGDRVVLVLWYKDGIDTPIYRWEAPDNEARAVANQQKSPTFSHKCGEGSYVVSI